MDKKQKERLYTLTEDFMFRYNLRDYSNFVSYWLMLKDTAPSEETKEVAKALILFLNPRDWRISKLMEKYYSEEEKDEYFKALKEEEIKEANERHQSRIQEYTKSIEDEIESAKTNEEVLQVVVGFAKRASYRDLEYFEVCNNFLEQIFEWDKILISNNNLSGFLNGVSIIADKGCLDLDKFKSAVGKLEVVE